jgi:hypothetical protein
MLLKVQKAVTQFTLNSSHLSLMLLLATAAAAQTSKAGDAIQSYTTAAAAVAGLPLLLLEVQKVVTQSKAALLLLVRCRATATAAAAASLRAGGSIHLALNSQFTWHSIHLGLLRLLLVATAVDGELSRQKVMAQFTCDFCCSPPLLLVRCSAAGLPLLLKIKKVVTQFTLNSSHLGLLMLLLLATDASGVCCRCFATDAAACHRCCCWFTIGPRVVGVDAV